MTARVAVFSSVMLLAGCATDTAPHWQVRGGQFTREPVIFSTRSSILAHGQWRFLLMPGEYRPTASENYSHLYSLPELAAAFRTLHPAAGIEWRDDTDNGWTYPPESLQKRVKEAAARYGHKVWLNPLITERP